MGNDIILPYSGHIPGGIHDGTNVVISGRVQGHAKRFSINLCVGPTYDQDCALHFNPRFDDNKVVRNHMQSGSWGTEETAGGMPFHKHMGFEIHMKVHHYGYKITVNHRHFCDFNHRLAKESVHYIYIEGDVEINYLQFRGGQQHHPSFPSVPSAPAPPVYPPGPSFPPNTGYPTGPSYPPVPSYPGGSTYGGPIYNPPVPFNMSIPGMLSPGRMIYVSGIPHPNPSRFTINLQCGPFESDDAALHFDVRFNYGNDRNQVIRTHKSSGNYGNEERQISFFPFYPGANFEIMILVEGSSFKVAVNNQHFLEFFFRIQPIQRVNHIGVVGDVRLTQVRFQ